MDKAFKKELEKAVVILKQFGAKEVYVFGSHSKGKARPGSDLDLAVKGIPPEKFYAAYGNLLTALIHEIHLIDLDEDNDFVKFLKYKGELRLVG